MELIYRRFYTPTRVLPALNSFFVSLLALTLLFSCKTDGAQRDQIADIKTLLKKCAEQKQRMEELNAEEIDKLNLRFNELAGFEGFINKHEILEILAAGKAFLSDLPMMTEEINNELANNQQQLQLLMKDLNQQLYTTEEVSLFLVQEKYKLEQLLMKVDYVRDRFSAWQLNAETIESAMRNTN
jgi:hypothetical protein